MTSAELLQWQRRVGLRTQKAAANALGLAPVSYRRKLRGQVKVGRQTEMLVACYEFRQAIDDQRLYDALDVITGLIKVAHSRR
jgi:hypothetical protein